MHDGTPCDPIQDQGQGHGASEVPKSALFQVCLLRHLQWELANDHCTISTFDRTGFLIFVLVFVSRDFELGRVPAVPQQSFYAISMAFGVQIEVDD